MRDGALKWSLRLLGIALVVVPILMALAAHGWDVKEAVLPSEEEISQVTERVSGIFGGGFSKDTITFGDPVVSGSRITVLVTFRSPLKVPMKITDFSVTVSDVGAQPIQLQMQESEVEIPANGAATFTLVGTVPAMPPQNPQMTGISCTFEVYGVSIHLSPEISRD